MSSTASFRELTPRGRAGAIACIAVEAQSVDDLDAALAQVCDDPPRETGSVVVRTIADIDHGVVVRWSEVVAHLMPHGGPVVVRQIRERLTALGIEAAESELTHVNNPFARSSVEARALAALSSASSPLAVDLLLAQHERWGGRDPHTKPDAELADSDTLARLLYPPLVVALGPANIGKSSLLNALAGRTEAVVANTPGTTRDPVGATLVLDGLAVRWIDTPGMLSGGPVDPIDAEAAELARAFVARADLLVYCADTGATAETAAGEPHPVADTPALLVRTRADLSPDPAGHAGGIVTSAATGLGIDDLARAIRQRLVPDSVLRDPRPWRFWDAISPDRRWVEP